MLERSRIWGGQTGGLLGALAGVAFALAGCATTEPAEPSPPAAAPTARVTKENSASTDPRALAEEARALLAQAETDIQRARARRALWARAWEALVAARGSMAAGENTAAIRLAKRASELAQLGLEQLAYPAVKQHATMVEESADRRLRSPS